MPTSTSRHHGSLKNAVVATPVQALGRLICHVDHATWYAVVLFALGWVDEQGTVVAAAYADAAWRVVRLVAFAHHEMLPVAITTGIRLMATLEVLEVVALAQHEGSVGDAPGRIVASVLHRSYACWLLVLYTVFTSLHSVVFARGGGVSGGFGSLSWPPAAAAYGLVWRALLVATVLHPAHGVLRIVACAASPVYAAPALAATRAALLDGGVRRACAAAASVWRAGPARAAQAAALWGAVALALHGRVPEAFLLYLAAEDVQSVVAASAASAAAAAAASASPRRAAAPLWRGYEITRQLAKRPGRSCLRHDDEDDEASEEAGRKVTIALCDGVVRHPSENVSQAEKEICGGAGFPHEESRFSAGKARVPTKKRLSMAEMVQKSNRRLLHNSIPLKVRRPF